MQRDMAKHDLLRRDFLKQAALGAAGYLAESTALGLPFDRVETQPVTAPHSDLGANERVRIGMIGVGGRGQELLKQVLETPNAQLVAVADIYSRRREEARQKAEGIQVFDDHRRLLEAKDIDADRKSV